MADTVILLTEARRRRQVQAQQRNRQGRFHGRTIPEILTLLAAVARYAVEHFPDDPDPKYRGPRHHGNPARVWQTLWNQARRNLEPELGPIPYANGLAAQLRAATGKKLPWSFWLEVALSDEKDPEKVMQTLMAEPPRELGRAEGAFMLIEAAKLDPPLRTLNPEQYGARTERLLERERGSGRGTFRAHRAIPTAEQIKKAFGSWEEGLRIAGLDPLRGGQTSRHTALPVPDAIAYFYAQRGALPTKRQLDLFAAEEAFALASTRGTAWTEWLAAGIKRIQDFRELPPPPRYGTTPDGLWTPQAIAIDPPPRGTARYTLPAKLEALAEFKDDLSQRPNPRERVPRDRRYKLWAQERPGRPSLRAILEEGPLREVMSLLDDPEWRHKADKEQQRREQEARAAQAEATKQRALTSSRSDRIVAIVRERGVATVPEITAALGLAPKTRGTVVTRINLLCDAGRLQRTQPERQSKRQAYRIPAQRSEEPAR